MQHTHIKNAISTPPQKKKSYEALPWLHGILQFVTNLQRTREYCIYVVVVHILKKKELVEKIYIFWLIHIQNITKSAFNLVLYCPGWGPFGNNSIKIFFINYQRTNVDGESD